MIDNMIVALRLITEAINQSEKQDIGVRVRLHRAKNYLIDAIRTYEDQRRTRDTQA